MDDVSVAILDAWNRVWPTLRNDPRERSARLARRRSRAMRSPPRAWCVAVRASDTRIHPASACIVPEDAAYPGRPDLYAEHEVVLDAALLRKLCRPVIFDGYGATRQIAAAALGISPSGVDALIRKGVIRAEKVNCGIRGQPIMILHSDGVLDPSSCSSKQRPDAVWGANWGHLADRVPDDFEQPVVRVPHDHPTRGCFGGWRWRCPGCARRVSTVFYPLAPINLPTYFGIEPAPGMTDGTDAADMIEPPLPTFACNDCHRVQRFTRLGTRAWNQMVAHVSGGLLYGAEVPRPAWVTQDRKKSFARRPRRQNLSPRFEEVRTRLLDRFTYKQIAADLGIALPTVCFHVKRIYRSVGVHSRAELIARTPQPTGTSERAAG